MTQLETITKQAPTTRQFLSGISAGQWCCKVHEQDGIMYATAKGWEAEICVGKDGQCSLHTERIADEMQCECAATCEGIFDEVFVLPD